MTEQYTRMRLEIERAVAGVFESQAFVLGETVARFERNMAEYSGCAHAVGVSSGTDALLCSLMALSIGPGDEVIVPTFTFFGTAGAVARTQATPVFVDVDPDSFNIDSSKIAQAVTDRTKAIIPVDLYGQMAPISEIMEIARRHKLAVIEDACQSVGSEQAGQRPGQAADCACLSFYPTKNLSGAGDGGMILCQDEAFAAKCRTLRVHGEHERYHHSVVGGNFRLDALQAAVLDVKLKHLDEWTARRRAHAAAYDELLAPAVQKPKISDGNVSVYNQYVIRSDKRDELREYLTHKQVGTMVYYPVPLHLQECFAHLGGKRGDCPAAEQACQEVLALPIYPELEQEHIAYVAECINGFYKGR